MATFEFKHLFYVANIIDYLRIALLWWALEYRDWRFCLLYTISMGLDAIDGIVARALDQCSDLGYYLDMIADRISTCTCLWVAAGMIIEGNTYIPAQYALGTVYVFYFCMLFVEILSHGVVCYFGEVLGLHQKKMGHKFAIVRMYLDNKKILFFTCGSFELFPLTVILFASGAPMPQLWVALGLISIPGFIFRALANLCRLYACLTLTAEEKKGSKM